MPPNENIAASIDDYLLALADGIYQAQRQLNRVSIEGQPGQPSLTYQLPRVDFEFKVTFALTESLESAGDKRGKQMAIRPADSVGSRTATMASTIKGTFVATPAGGGKPPSRLTTEAARTPNPQARVYVIRARVLLATGEAVRGARVEFNIDRDLSGRINAAPVGLKAGTRLEYGVKETDERGYAEVCLEIDAGEAPGTCVAVQVNAVDAEDILVFSAPQLNNPSSVTQP